MVQVPFPALPVIRARVQALLEVVLVRRVLVHPDRLLVPMVLAIRAMVGHNLMDRPMGRGLEPLLGL